MSYYRPEPTGDPWTKTVRLSDGVVKRYSDIYRIKDVVGGCGERGMSRTVVAAVLRPTLTSTLFHILTTCSDSNPRNYEIKTALAIRF